MAEMRMLGMSVSISGGEFEPVSEFVLHAPERTYVRSESAVLPDPTWVVVDANGHEHRWTHHGRRWNREDALPTLRRHVAHVRCDGTCGEGDCGGYGRTLYSCRQCGLWVTPAFVPDHEARTTGVPIETGPGYVELVLDRELTLQDRLPIAIRDLSGTVRRGTAYAAEGEWSSDGAWTRLTASLEE